METYFPQRNAPAGSLTQSINCLNMIVKNEAHVIERCFDHIAPYCNYWIISDTGSTDGTQELIIKYWEKKGVPGFLFEDPWVKFDHNRNLALEHARDVIKEKNWIVDKFFIMDADDVLELDPEPFVMAEGNYNAKIDENYVIPKLEGDLYFMYSYRGVKYFRPHLLTTKKAFHWKGALHESLYPVDGAESQTINYGNLYGLCVQPKSDGARSQNPKKYHNDALLLEKEMKRKENKNNSRDQFYLARSWHDAREYEKAIKAYDKRTTMTWGVIEETYISQLYAGRCAKTMKAEKKELIGRYMTAWAFRPQRLEALYELLQELFQSKHYGVAFKLGKMVLPIKPSTDCIFVEAQLWNWQFLWKVIECGFYGDIGELEVIILFTQLAIEKKYPEHCINNIYQIGWLISLSTSSKWPLTQWDLVRRITDLPNIYLEFFQKHYSALLYQHETAESWLKFLFPTLQLIKKELDIPITENLPTIMIAVLAKNCDYMILDHLNCIHEQQYPKEKIIVFFQIEHNDDNTEKLIEVWVNINRDQYKQIIIEKATIDHKQLMNHPWVNNQPRNAYTQTPSKLDQYYPHSWTNQKMVYMALLKDKMIKEAEKLNCEYCLFCDVGDFIAPRTLKNLIFENKPIIAPQLVSIPEMGDSYSNYFTSVDKNGYFVVDERYWNIWCKKISDVHKVDAVHSTFLINIEKTKGLSFSREKPELDFITFCRNARNSDISMFIDNRYYYGYMVHHDGVNECNISRTTEKEIYQNRCMKWIQGIKKM